MTGVSAYFLVYSHFLIAVALAGDVVEIGNFV
jgi:hypothetical protein